MSSIMDGTHRVAITDNDPKSNGITLASAIHKNHGILTWTLRKVAWHFHRVAESPRTAGRARLIP
jgi:hypothetical protein